MERDNENTYRLQLEDLEPDFQDRVNTPWQENIPDVPSYNKKAYILIERQVRRMSKIIEKGENASSRGILVLGEPGTGKTHLLMRVAHKLGNANHIMFVRKPNNESAVASHIWINIIQSLTQKIPGSSDITSQLDKMLARVFASVIIPFLEKDIAAGKDAARKQAWVDKLKENPENLSAMLGTGETRAANVAFIRRRTLSYLNEHEPGIDQKTARALITYCFIVQHSSKYALLSWLQGQQIESGTASLLKIPQIWVGSEEDTDSSIRQQNEEQALRAIKTIGLLARHYQSLILAFDQLEGLNQQQSMTLSWGDTVREIFTVAPNFVVVTCLFPSIWESWFQQQLDQSVRERMAQYSVSMENFSMEHAADILRVRMKNAYETLKLPHRIYPFTQFDIEILCRKKRSLRSFLNNASNRFDQWLDEDEDVTTPSQPRLEQDTFFESPTSTDNERDAESTKKDNTQEDFYCEDDEEFEYTELSEEKLQECRKQLQEHEEDEKACLEEYEHIAAEHVREEYEEHVEEEAPEIRAQKLHKLVDKTLEKQQRYHSRSIHNHICNEEEFLGVLRDFITQFLHYRDFKFEVHRSSYRNLVMPPNAVIELDNYDRPLVIAVCSKQGHSLSSRIKNLVNATNELNDPLIILLKNWSNKDALSNFHVKKLQEKGHYLRTSKRESCQLMALYDLLIAVEQQDLAVDDRPIDKAELFDILLQGEILHQSSLFHTMLEHEQWPKRYTRNLNKQSTQPIHDVAKKLEETTPLPKSKSASFFNNLELPVSNIEDFNNAAVAIKEEFEYYDTVKIVEAVRSELVEEQKGRKVYRLQLDSSLYFDWKIEGSTAFCFEDDITKKYKWRGDVVGFVSETQEIFIATYAEISAPCEFHVQPFEFMHNLYSLYNGEDYRELAIKYLPSILVACKGDVYPTIRSRTSYVGIEKLRDVWEHSWGIIWGPPGTGKTYTIGQQVASCINNKAQERFLVVSTTNKATDEAILSIAKAISIPMLLDKVIRVGSGVDFAKFPDHLSRIVHCKYDNVRTQITIAQDKFSRSKSAEEQAKLRSEIKDLRRSLTDSSAEIFENDKYQVVVTTAFNAISMLTKTNIFNLLCEGKTPFTTVIIDEAGIISKAATAALAMFASSRVVLVGDPKQLSPITRINRVLPSNQAMWLGESAVNHLKIEEQAHSAKYILTEQYRMHPLICRAVSSYQYADQLKNSETVIERDDMEDLADLPRASWYVIDEDTDDLTEIRARRSEQNTSWLRPHTCKVLDKIFSAFPKFIDSSGLFIAPFTAQIETISNYLMENNIVNWQAATVHSQQGAEADIVIFDTVYASSGAWSYAEWQRLINVAISRARQWVIVIASRQEMQQPYLASLANLLVPVVFPKGKRLGVWKSVAPNIKYNIPQEILDNPHLLGNQLRNRKMLRPILSFEQQRLCELKIDGKPRLVRGVAGSGKTVVLAHWIAKSLINAPHKQICVVYANASLKSLIHNTIHRAWEEISADKPFPEEQLFLIHVIDLLTEIQSILDVRYKGDHFDYDARARICLQELYRIKPLCDELFIDEAQDLGPTTLKLLFSIIKKNPTTGQRPAMIFYDNAQNLYDRRTPKWSDFGLELRGRSTIMKESFRSTNPICEFALNVLYKLKPSELNSDHQELVNLGLLKLIEDRQKWKVHYNKVDGPQPKFFEYDNLNDEIEAIGDHIQDWVEKEGVTPNDITILYLGKNIPKRIMKDLGMELAKIGIQMQWQTSSNFNVAENTIVMTTPHSFKGYDSEIIVIAGADQFASNDDEIRARSLYVAMTRARSILHVYAKTYLRDCGKKTVVDVLRECSQ